MISVETARGNHAAAAWVKGGMANSKTRAFQQGAVRDMALRELHLSGSQLLVGSIGLLSSISLVLWAVLKLWLFEP